MQKKLQLLADLAWVVFSWAPQQVWKRLPLRAAAIGVLVLTVGITLSLQGSDIPAHGEGAGAPSESGSPGEQPVFDPPPAPGPVLNNDELAAAVEEYLADYGDVHCSVYVSVGDETFEYDADRHYDTASIVKVDILATLLYQHEQDGTSMSARQRSQAEKMITASDNKATDDLYGDIDGPNGLKTANKAFGLKDTKAGWDWGTVKTTARDQVALWKAITTEGVLGAESVALVRELTGSVVGWQSWGISAAAGMSDVTLLKNGWDTRASIGGRWVVNSTGMIEKSSGQDVYLAILTDNHGDYKEAVKIVEGLAALVGAQL